jgi:capsular exopolysaccharide synthesis family protein
LSEALKRAATTAVTPVVVTDEPTPPAGEWKFSPVETMYVPEERPSEAALPYAVVPDAATAAPAPATPPAGFTEVPHLPAVQFSAGDRDKLVVSSNVDPAVVEQYRHLAATFHQAQKTAGVRTVTVTSAVPSEGKTLTATNLALTLSGSYQRRVLLVDADLRRPRLREMFGLSPSPGLADVLTSGIGNRLPVHHVTPNLWVLAAGTVVADPMNLLVSPAMKQLLDDAREAFDWVIVDTPPIAVLPDANLLSAMIDTALLVVSAQSTPYPMVQRAVDAIGPQKVIGVVLNRAEQIGPTAQYAYGYAYGTPITESGSRGWFGWLRKRRDKSHVQ